jgi:hypothetical protein
MTWAEVWWDKIKASLAWPPKQDEPVDADYENWLASLEMGDGTEDYDAGI